MRLFYLLTAVVLLNSCAEDSITEPTVDQMVVIEEQLASETIQTEFQEILDSSDVHGSILIYDAQQNTFHSNDFDWARTGQLPASTFKIVNSIIGLETRNITSTDSLIFKWNGESYFKKSWEQNLNLHDAFHESCVPCYQQLARDIGIDSMQVYLEKLKFGNMVLDSSNLDMFWLRGDSRITQFEQIDFLQKLHNLKLSISPDTRYVMENLMIIEDSTDVILRGKTGWSSGNNFDNGWFVGYIEIDKKFYYFATNIEPNNDTDLSNFIAARKEVTLQAFNKLGIL